MQPNKKLTVEFTGSEADLQELVRALTAINYFGAIGASRDVVIAVDGDGAGQIGVNFPNIKGEVEPGKVAKDAADSGKAAKYYIGY